jgi:hypothetical protein
MTGTTVTKLSACEPNDHHSVKLGSVLVTPWVRFSFRKSCMFLRGFHQSFQTNFLGCHVDSTWPFLSTFLVGKVHYPLSAFLKLALTSPTSGGGSVGIVRWRTKPRSFIVYFPSRKIYLRVHCVCVCASVFVRVPFYLRISPLFSTFQPLD